MVKKHHIENVDVTDQDPLVEEVNKWHKRDAELQWQVGEYTVLTCCSGLLVSTGDVSGYKVSAVNYSVVVMHGLDMRQKKKLIKCFLQSCRRALVQETIQTHMHYS